ncbi:MAG: class I lanthipeptide [Spirosomataceae bacterium]
MKKQLIKLSLKTDKIVSLSKASAQQVAGGAKKAAPTTIYYGTC